MQNHLRHWLIMVSALLLCIHAPDSNVAAALGRHSPIEQASACNWLNSRSTIQAELDAPQHVTGEHSGRRTKKKRQNLSKWGRLHQRYPGIFILRGSGKERKVSLTFDDVPDTRYTPEVLDILAKYKVKATFFVVGSRAAAHPELVRRMRREGHTIGNHSYDHALFSRLTDEAYRKQILRTERILQPLIGYRTRFIRPPYGEIKPEQVEWAARSGYIVVNWDVDSADWKSISSRQVLANVSRTLRPGSIILQHAGGGAKQDLTGTIQALPELIRTLRLKGYRIVTLDELLHQPKFRKGMNPSTAHKQ